MDDLEVLRHEVRQLLADALRSGEAHTAELRHLEAELGELVRLEKLADDERANLEHALQSRDVIGQAKGIIMASLGCGPDAAFALLVKQSQAENRKLVDVAALIAQSAERHRRPVDPG